MNTVTRSSSFARRVPTAHAWDATRTQSYRGRGVGPATISLTGATNVIVQSVTPVPLGITCRLVELASHALSSGSAAMDARASDAPAAMMGTLLTGNSAEAAESSQE